MPKIWKEGDSFYFIRELTIFKQFLLGTTNERIKQFATCHCIDSCHCKNDSSSDLESSNSESTQTTPTRSMSFSSISFDDAEDQAFFNDRKNT